MLFRSQRDDLSCFQLHHKRTTCLARLEALRLASAVSSGTAYPRSPPNRAPTNSSLPLQEESLAHVQDAQEPHPPPPESRRRRDRHSPFQRRRLRLPRPSPSFSSSSLPDRLTRSQTKALALPTEQEMRPKDKYSVFSRTDPGYRKSVHKVPKWTRLTLRLNPLVSA